MSDHVTRASQLDEKSEADLAKKARIDAVLDTCDGFSAVETMEALLSAFVTFVIIMSPDLPEPDKGIDTAARTLEECAAHLRNVWLMRQPKGQA